MSDFLMYSIIGSVVLTVLINVLPMIFPKASRKAQEKISERVNDAIEKAERGERPRVQVFFPWKAMLIISIVLTLLVNGVNWFASR
jgi:hypothetical protein